MVSHLCDGLPFRLGPLPERGRLVDLLLHPLPARPVLERELAHDLARGGHLRLADRVRGEPEEHQQLHEPVNKGLVDELGI